MQLSVETKKNAQKNGERKFQTLRLSLLPICNFACVYCKTGDLVYKKSLIQKSKFYIDIIKNLKNYIDIKKIHLTGGEPTLYPYLGDVVRGIKRLQIPEVSITTNGTLLKRRLKELVLAGLDGINLSLDAMDDQILQRMGTKKNFFFYNDLIQSIQNYKIKLKINTTVIKGYNENQILPLLNYCGGRGIPIRFLEYMQMGVNIELHKKRFFGKEDIINLIQSDYQIKELPREKHSTSKYWITHTGYKFGIIANHSDPFCYDCDRLRIDSMGNLYGCITQEKGIQYSKKNLKEILDKSLQYKQNFFKGSSNSMHQLGG
ncbi:MAG: radical SAM protein [Leptonema sp. (in: bacteria)]